MDKYDGGEAFETKPSSVIVEEDVARLEALQRREDARMRRLIRHLGQTKRITEAGRRVLTRSVRVVFWVYDPELGGQHPVGKSSLKVMGYTVGQLRGLFLDAIELDRQRKIRAAREKRVGDLRRRAQQKGTA